ncbi:MAG: hypothetical protein HOE44_16420 [Candidatus Marinimicrobia bacterium]|nr:hypothetical protein [Candidatus Neomarinimicrobiota bacterium]
MVAKKKAPAKKKAAKKKVAPRKKAAPKRRVAAKEKRPVGRPPKYSSVEELETLIEEYFHGDDAFMIVGDGIKVHAPTVSGLAYHLDMSTEALRNYEQKGEFLATIKKAKQRVEIALEKRLGGTAPAGTIFNLKNNFGWKDKQEIDHNVAMSHEDALDQLDG